MHQSNNDTTVNTWEWTIARTGTSNINFFAWGVYIEGSFSQTYVSNAYGIRPVFYLTSNQAILGGNGSLDDPFMIPE